MKLEVLLLTTPKPPPIATNVNVATRNTMKVKTFLTTLALNQFFCD